MSSKYEKLGKYLPDGALPIIINWLESAPIRIKVTRPRQSKLGDYAPATPTDPVHRITINRDLNPYSFLVTLVHEFAHFTSFHRASWHIKPHGREWQYEYARLMGPFLDRGIFPADVHVALEEHLKRAPASSCSDPVLIRILRSYDQGPAKTHVEDLPLNSVFRLGKRTFIKGRKLRKRYQCRCIEDKREYYVDALAEILPCPTLSY
jgi:hypothetical protein